MDKIEAEHERHIENVLSTCKKLGCTRNQLLHMDYMKLLKENMVELTDFEQQVLTKTYNDSLKSEPTLPSRK